MLFLHYFYCQHLFLQIYQIFFNDTLHSWFSQNYLWLIGLLTAIAIIILIIEKQNQKVDDFFTLEETKNYLSHFFLVLSLILILFSPNFLKIADAYKNASQKNYLFLKTDSSNITSGLIKSVGDQPSIDYIMQKVPPKSVFISSGRDVFLAELVDQHMAAYPHSSNETLYNKIFEEGISSNEKIKYLKEGNVDYVLISSSSKKSFFELNPQIFTKIYQQKVTIYQVNFL